MGEVYPCSNSSLLRILGTDVYCQGSVTADIIITMLWYSATLIVGIYHYNNDDHNILACIFHIRSNY